MRAIYTQWPVSHIIVKRDAAIDCRSFEDGE
jgi:hypothetical protein